MIGRGWSRPKPDHPRDDPASPPWRKSMKTIDTATWIIAIVLLLILAALGCLGLPLPPG